MKRYLSLYFHFFRNCLARELEFRFNILLWSLIGFLWFGLMFFSVELVFGQVQAIAGWSKNEVMLLVCAQALVFDLLWLFVLSNFRDFSRLIRRGDLDFALLKPVNLRFLVSARYLELDHFPRALFLLYLIPRILNNLQVYPSLFSWITSILLFFLGIFILYNFFFIIITTNFWLVNLANFPGLFDEVLFTARFPIDIFKGRLKLLFPYIVPVAFIATFPVRALLGKVEWEIILVGVLIALVMFAISQWFWQFALRHYQSASS